MAMGYANLNIVTNLRRRMAAIIARLGPHFICKKNAYKTNQISIKKDFD